MAAGYAHHVLYTTALQIARTLDCTGRVRIVLGKHPVISLYPTINYIIQSLGYITGGGASKCSDHILLGQSNEVRKDYMSGEIRGGLGEMMVATTDSVLARQLPVQKCRVCMCSPPR